jgi:hypothetical protein
MTSKWLVLTAAIKAIFLVVPFLDLSGDFNLGDRLDEAKEFAAAGSTKGMLFTSPILLELRMLYETSQVCRAGGDGFRIALSFVALGAVLVGCYAIPTRLFRGSWTPFAWFIILTAAERAFEICLLKPIAEVVCA